MSERFGEAAARLSSAASVILGWRPHEFWNSTPAELMIAISFNEGVSNTPDARTIDELLKLFPDK